MVRLKPKKRGPKYSVGEGKRRLLLITLNYPDGISESSLINETKEKLSFTSSRGIKGHLDDLGPGRTIEKKWIEGKHYLIKIPSKFEPKNTKKRLIKKLNDHGVEIDIDNLPEENIWKPDKGVVREIGKLYDGEQYRLFISTNIVREVISSRINELRDFDPDFDPELVWVLQEAAQVSPMVARLLLEGELNTDHLKETYEKIEIHFREEYLGIGDNVLLKIIVACILQDYLTGSEETKQRIKNNCELELTCSP